MDAEAAGIDLPGEPFHLRPVRGGLVGDDQAHVRRVAENAGEAVEHAGCAAEHFGPGPGVGAVEPGGEADAAGHAVQFGDAQAVVGEQNVGPDDARQLGAELFAALQVDDRLRLAAIQPSAWPGGEAPLGAPAVNRVGGLVKLEQHAAQLLELLDGFLVERKRLRGDAPLVPGEEPAGGQALPDVLRDLFERRLGVDSHQREPT